MRSWAGDRIVAEHRELLPTQLLTTDRAMLMASKLIEPARPRWRAVNTPHLAALLCAGATVTGGKLAERPGYPGPADAAAEAA